MEFIKVGKNYMIKNGNGRIITEKEKLELENNELVIKDIKGCNCQQETTKKIKRNKKRIKEIIEEEKNKEIPVIETMDELDTAPVKENADDIIEETDSTL